VSEPLAYLITCRTYGTWLHGDARGSVDRDHNIYGTPMRDTHRALQQAERRRLKTPPVTLTARQRELVAETIRTVCRTRGWSLLALNVRTTHFHAVVAAPDPPERVMHAFKAYATRRLREAGLQAQDVRLWSRHGSTRYLWKPTQVENACRYAAESQGEDLGGEL
jgi:REP element-mobilizing transposase RayT